MWPQVRYLILSLTSRCNLRCQYCYHAATGQGQDMSDQVIDTALSRVDQGQQPLLIQISGGEPTLVPDTIERVALHTKTMQRKPHLAIQTNATLLTEPLVHIFHKAAMQVGVSLDGPPLIQEELRGHADASLHGLRLLENARIPFRVTTVVSEANVHTLDKLVLMLAGYRQCRGIGLDLLVSKGRASQMKIGPAHTRELEQGLGRMVETLRAINGKRRQPIILREQNHLQKRTREQPFCHAATGSSLAISSDGNLYPCGQTMGDPLFFMGTIAHGFQKSTASLNNITLPRDDCADCALGPCCPGECPSRIYYNGAQATHQACVLYRYLETCWR